MNHHENGSLFNLAIWRDFFLSMIYHLAAVNRAAVK